MTPRRSRSELPWPNRQWLIATRRMGQSDDMVRAATKHDYIKRDGKRLGRYRDCIEDPAFHDIFLARSSTARNAIFSCPEKHSGLQ